MNHHPSRFRPCLEALEERSLLSVSVLEPTVGSYLIDATQSEAHNTIYLFNNGNGHIGGYITGDAAGAGFFNLAGDFLGIRGGPGGTEVYYYQRGDQVAGSNLLLFASFAKGNNLFDANLQSATLRGQLTFQVEGGGGIDNISINATNVTIAGGALLTTVVPDDNSPPGGTTYFSEDYSGINRGKLVVVVIGGTDTQDSLGVGATFLGAPASRSTIPGRGAFGAAPGDLSLFGGDGDNSMEMLLSSPGGLSATGDVYGGSGENSCFRTANVKSHNCQQDVVLGSRMVNRIGTHHVLPGF
jgi:hypothetical protein